MRVWIFFCPADLLFKGQAFVTIRQLTSVRLLLLQVDFTLDSCFNQVVFVFGHGPSEAVLKKYIQSGFVDFANY